MSETGQKRWFSPVQMHKSRDSGWLISHPGEAAARSPPHPVKPWLKRPYFRAFSFAHLARCAAAMLARPAALILRVGFLTATAAVPCIFSDLAFAAARIFARLAALIVDFFFGVGAAGGVGVDDWTAEAGMVPGRARALVISVIWVAMLARSWSSVTSPKRSRRTDWSPRLRHRGSETGWP